MHYTVHYFLFTFVNYQITDSRHNLPDTIMGDDGPAAAADPTPPPLQSLPEELLCLILSRLDDPEDVLSASLTCRALRRASLSEPLWERLLLRRYRVRAALSEHPGWSPRRLYLRLLRYAGEALGTWQRVDLVHYGSLHQVCNNWMHSIGTFWSR